MLSTEGLLTDELSFAPYNENESSKISSHQQKKIFVSAKEVVLLLLVEKKVCLKR